MVLAGTQLVMLDTKVKSIEPSAAWEKQLRERMLLPCGHWRRPLEHSLDVHVNKIVVGDAALLSVRGFGSVLRIARAGFFRLLSSVANRSVQFGSVYDDQGNVLNSWRTVWSQKPVELRGGKESTLEFCTKCGEVLYWPWPRESYHVLRSDRGLADVCFLDLGLLVSPSIADSIQKAHLKKLEYYPVQIVDSPLDGLPADLHSLRETPDKWRRYKFNPPNA